MYLGYVSFINIQMGFFKNTFNLSSKDIEDIERQLKMIMIPIIVKILVLFVTIH